MRRHFLSKKVFLCFKKVLEGKKGFKEGFGNLLRTHFLSKKVSEPSPLLCSPPLRVFKKRLHGGTPSWVHAVRGRTATHASKKGSEKGPVLPFLD